MSAATSAGHKYDISTDAITMTRFVLGLPELRAHGGITILLSSIQLACKSISAAVRKAGIAGLYGLEGSVNVSGDDQKKLDVVAHETFVNACKFSRELCVMVSEEEEAPIVIEEHLSGKYCIVTDPLDGSSNIDCNISTGTIFGIYEKTPGPGCIDDVLRPGTELLVAGYCMYGSSTEFVLATHSGVNVFTLDPSIGEFILTNRNLQIPSKPKTIYSVNEGNSKFWDGPTSKFVDTVKGMAKPYSLRYVGSMVSDVHRTLLYGGVFMYPGDSKSPKGKLRLLYEANPMAFICEKAGGMAFTGKQRVLEMLPESIHARTPIFLGCARDVAMIMELYGFTPDMIEAHKTKRMRVDDDAERELLVAEAGADGGGGGGGGAGGSA